MTGLEEFVRQSNAIEGIFRTAYSDEIAAHEELLALPRITVLDVQTFVFPTPPEASGPPRALNVRRVVDGRDPGVHAVKVGSLFSGVGGFDLGLERA